MEKAFYGVPSMRAEARAIKPLAINELHAGQVGALLRRGMEWRQEKQKQAEEELIHSTRYCIQTNNNCIQQALTLPTQPACKETPFSGKIGGLRSACAA